MRARFVAATTLLLAASTLPAACSEDAAIEPVQGATTATATGSGGAGGAGGSGGQGGVEPPSRGDPSEFPTDCLATCVEACAHVADCDGATSPIYPITIDECELLCGVATNGPVWDDVSGNFRCCASQAECSDVQHCGGWLAHPSPEGSCKKLCTCFFSEAAQILANAQAPEGYRFAPDVVMVEPSAGASLADARVPGVRSIDAGTTDAPAIVHFDRDAGAGTLADLATHGRLLPTFLDPAGRVVAATGRIVIAAESAAARDRAAARAAKLPGARVRPLRAKVAAAVDRLRVVELDPWEALVAVRSLAEKGVSAELDMIRPYERRYVPNDPLFASQWHLRNAGEPGIAPSVDGRVDEAWDTTLGDPGVIVAINDDGVDLDHPDFAGKLEPELNYPADWKTQMMAGQFGGHGTSCAGVAVAKADDAVGGAGVCPGCKVLPHLLGPSSGGQFQISDVDIAEGFNQVVDAGAWVISNSWGPSTGNPVYVEQTFPLPALPAVVKAAYDYAETTGRGGLGTVILFAAGNSNDKLDYNGTYATNVAVGAVGDVGLKSYYSSFGTALGVAAPSNGGVRGITTSAANGQHTDSFGGTSSACPYAAGVVGLVFSANPALTAAEARGILEASATRIDPVWGAWTPEGSPFYGAGLVNAYKAVQLANGGCADPATCLAPSDDCGASCGTVSSCGACRTDADCVAGSACQALPSVGMLVCVAQKDANPCPAGTNEVNGYCVPTAATCGACAGAEACNGHDEDCDGLVDEEGCQGAPRCFIDAAGCAAGSVCAATSCAPQCTTDADCTEPATCLEIKDQYGLVTGTRACVASGVSQCQLGCEVLASSLPDAELAAFVDCMKDGQTGCGSAFTCAQMLPVNF